jgi:hypothetical protein
LAIFLMILPYLATSQPSLKATAQSAHSATLEVVQAIEEDGPDIDLPDTLRLQRILVKLDFACQEYGKIVQALCHKAARENSAFPGLNQ